VLPATQAIFQPIGDSINSPDTANGICEYYLDSMPLPWNAFGVPANANTSKVGYTNASGGFVSTQTQRGPSYFTTVHNAEVWNDGSSAIAPVYGLDIVCNNGSGAAYSRQFGDIVSRYDFRKWLRSENYSLSATANKTSHFVFAFDGSQIIPALQVLGGRGAGGNVEATLTKASTNLMQKMSIGKTWIGSGVGSGNPTSTMYGGTSTVTGSTDNKVMVFGGLISIDNTVGVQYSTPLAIGGYTTDDHLNTAFCSDANLARWYSLKGNPTHIILWIGQNLTVTQSAELADGTTDDFKAKVALIIARHDAACVANGAAKPKYMMVNQYKTGYSATVSETRGQALYELSQAEPTRIAYLNLYQLAGGESMPVDTTYLADGVHPNATGKSFFVQLIWREMQNSLTTMPFRALDSFHHPYTAGNHPDRRYRVVDTSDAAVSTVVSVSGGAMVFTSAAGATTTVCLRHDNGTDHIWGDTYTQCKIIQKTATNTTSWKLFARYTHAGLNYSVDFGLVANTYTVRMGATTIASGSVTIAVNDVARLEVTGTGSSTVVVVKVNGSTISTTTVSAANGIPACGLGGVGFTGVTASTLQIDDLDIGPLGSGAPSTGAYLGRAPVNPALGRLGIYIETQNASESNAQGRVIDALWNPGGFTADWAGYLRTYVDPVIAAYPSVRRLSIRGFGGHNFGTNGIGFRVGLGYTTTANPSATQLVAQIFNLRACDLYRNVTDSGFTTGHVMTDGRLLDGFKGALYPYLSLLDEIRLYGCAPPSGTITTAGTSAGLTTPRAWTNSNVAFDEWDAEPLDLGAASSVINGAGVSVDLDSQIQDPGGIAGSLPAENTMPKAYTERLRTTRTHRVGLEPPPDLYNQGGTSGNLTYYLDARFGFIGATDPIRANDTVARGIDYPTQYFGKGVYVSGQEAIAWVTGQWSNTNDRRDAAVYYLKRGYTVFLEFSGLSPDQIAPIVAAASTGTGRTVRTARAFRK